MNEQLPKTSGADVKNSEKPYGGGGGRGWGRRSVHLFQSNQRYEAIEFLDRHVSEKL